MQFKSLTDDRKAVVKAIEEILTEKAKYQGPPSFAYVIGEFTVDREGNILTEDEEAGEKMQTELANRGLAEGEGDIMNLKLPLDGMDANKVINLIFMTKSRQYLLNKVFDKQVFNVTDELISLLELLETPSVGEINKLIKDTGTKGIELDTNEGVVVFTDLPLLKDTLDPYLALFAAMVKCAKEQKRVSPKEVIEENEKYYFRAWLVRLGLGGGTKKEYRKVLLSNLKGHTAFRTEADREKWKEKNQNKANS